MNFFSDAIGGIALVVMFLAYVSPIILLTLLGGFLWFKIPGANLNRRWRMLSSTSCFVWGLLSIHLVRNSWLKGSNIDTVFIILLVILGLLWTLNVIWQILPNKIKSVHAQSYYVWLEAKQNKTE